MSTDNYKRYQSAVEATRPRTNPLPNIPAPQPSGRVRNGTVNQSRQASSSDSAFATHESDFPPARPKGKPRVALSPDNHLYPPGGAGSRGLTPMSGSSASANRHSRSPLPGLGWLFQPAGSSHARPIAPAERAFYALGGAAIWLFGAFLTSVYMALTIPAFKGQAMGIVTPKPSVNHSGLETLSLGAILAGLAASLLFMLVELMIWKGNHAPIVWVIGLAFWSMDVGMNIIGCMALLQVQTLTWLDDASLFVVTLGTGVALLPEVLMALAFRK